MLVQEAKVSDGKQRMQELVADVAKIATEVGFEAQVRGETVTLWFEGRHECDVTVWDGSVGNERVNIESDRRGSRTTHIYVEAAGCGRDGWHSKLRTALRFRVKRAAEEAAVTAAKRAKEARKRAEEARGLDLIGEVPDCAGVQLYDTGWHVSLDVYRLSVEQAAAVACALRLVLCGQTRRVEKMFVRDQDCLGLAPVVAALKKSLRFVPIPDLDGESTEGKRVISALRSQIHGHREVTKDDIDARFRADRAARSRTYLALHGVCATPICGATTRYCQLEPGHAGEHSIFPPHIDDAEVAQ